MNFIISMCFLALVFFCGVAIYAGVAWLIILLVNLVFTTAWQFTFWQYMGMGALILIARNLFKK